jgi:hypothetical protein
MRVLMFWERAVTHSNSKKTTCIVNRPRRSLEAKLTLVKQNITKFNNAQKAIVALNESGSTEKKCD